MLSSLRPRTQDGTLAAITKDKTDNKYHVVGKLVVVHEITMMAAATNLKRLLAVCGERKCSSSPSACGMPTPPAALQRVTVSTA
jgi:hypothetical protein